MKCKAVKYSIQGAEILSCMECNISWTPSENKPSAAKCLQPVAGISTDPAQPAPAWEPFPVLEKGRLKAAAVLHAMADTFEERSKVYGDNFRMVAPLMAVLFPKGVPPELVVKDQFHLFELILVKLSRFAISNLTHQDSIHDLAVYGAMIEAIIQEQQQ